MCRANSSIDSQGRLGVKRRDGGWHCRLVFGRLRRDHPVISDGKVQPPGDSYPPAQRQAFQQAASTSRGRTGVGSAGSAGLTGIVVTGFGAPWTAEPAVGGGAAGAMWPPRKGRPLNQELVPPGRLRGLPAYSSSSHFNPHRITPEWPSKVDVPGEVGHGAANLTASLGAKCLVWRLARPIEPERHPYRRPGGSCMRPAAAIGGPASASDGLHITPADHSWLTPIGSRGQRSQ
jgi:hypothetical protein